MPFEGPNDPKLPSNVQKLTEAQRRKWAKTWNSVFENCRDPETGGGSGTVKKCEGVAFQIANGTIKKEVEVVENKSLEIVKESCKHGVPADKCLACITGATSFEELEKIMASQEQIDKMQELSTLTEGMVGNVLRNEEMDIDDKPGALQKIFSGFVKRIKKIKPGEAKDVDAEKQVTKTEEGIQFRASDYAVVPDREKPSTWKLRLAEKRSGNFTVPQVARAITAMQPSGFRGQRVQLTGDQRKQAVSRIGAAIGKTGGTDDQKDNLRRRLDRVKEMKIPTFMITKDKDGNMRWIGVPSNKWRDRDNPPQIIEEAAHKEFIEYLDQTKEFPILLSWHTPGTRIGVADFADYGNGFLIMGGPIDKGKYAEAEKLAEKCQAEDVGMSHGFVYTYSDKEREIIGKYRTWEVSHLPLSKAANVWTAFDILIKEVKPMLDPEKRKYLVDLHGEEVVSGIESRASDLEKDLVSAGIEFKDLELEAGEESPRGDSEAAAQEAIKTLVESDGFRAMITAIKELNDGIKELKETTIPGITKRVEAIEVVAKVTAEKTGKSVDEIIAEAFTSKSGAFQPSKEGEAPSEEEQKEEEINAVSTPVDENMFAGMFGNAQKPD